jgi:butyryl-CoA dehydrogenase
MDFYLSEEQLALQATVRKFAKEQLEPGIIARDEIGEDGGYPKELYKEMAKLGLIGLPYPVEFGGQGKTYLEYAIAVEEISKVDAALGISYSVSTSLFGGSVDSGASPEQKKAWLPPVLTGETWGAFGLTEANAGSDAGGCTLQAVKDGDNYILNGSKVFNTNGPLANSYVIFALTELGIGSKGLSALYVERDKTPGFTIGKVEKKMGIRTALVSELIFENAKVPVANLLGGKEKEGFKVAMKALDGGRIGVAAQGLGIAEGAYEKTVEYLKIREQFGKPLFKNQYLAWKIAELSIEIEQAKYLVYKAALDKASGRPYGDSAARAKFAATNAAMHVTTEAVQFLGGNGYMKDYHVERMMRDAKITQIYEGTNEMQKLIVSGPLFR